MSQNAILKGTDNTLEVKFSFTGDFEQLGLNTFSEITFSIGNETYSTRTTPTKLYIKDTSQGQFLVLSISMDTDLAAGHYLPEIKGYSDVYDDGFLLTGKCKPYLKYLYVTDCN